MRILHVITSLRTGGAEKLMVDLLPRFRDMGAEVDLLIFDGTATPFRKALEATGIRVIDFGKGGSVYNPLHAVRLAKLMRNYDIVHTHNTACQLFGAFGSLFSKAKLITTEHSSSNRRRGNRLLYWLDLWMYSRYNCIICIADKTATNLRMHLRRKEHGEDNITTILNGVDVNKYASATPSSELKSGLPEGTKAITMVAGFRWEKDQDTAIKALTFLPEEFHTCFVGDGVRRKECEQLAEQLGVSNRTHFMGIRSDVANILRASDYIVMSSHFEGLSLSSVEGMSVGKPFLASDVDGLREVVKDAGVLFPHSDAEALAQEIRMLDADPTYYRNVAEACRKRASQYDISTMANEYLTCYSKMQ